MSHEEIIGRRHLSVKNNVDNKLLNISSFTERGIKYQSKNILKNFLKDGKITDDFHFLTNKTKKYVRIFFKTIYCEKWYAKNLYYK